MIPIVLLGEKEDKAIFCALKKALKGRCGWFAENDFCWEARADVLLMDAPPMCLLDAGGGIVVFKESFCAHCIPKHLLHTRCVLPSNIRAAQEFAVDCGLPVVSCGGQFDTLTVSSMQEQTVLTVQKSFQRLDGSEVAAGDFTVQLPEYLSANELLCCAAVLLLLGQI